MNLEGGEVHDSRAGRNAARVTVKAGSTQHGQGPQVIEARLAIDSGTPSGTSLGCAQGKCFAPGRTFAAAAPIVGRCPLQVPQAPPPILQCPLPARLVGRCPYAPVAASCSVHALPLTRAYSTPGDKAAALRHFFAGKLK